MRAHALVLPLVAAKERLLDYARLDDPRPVQTFRFVSDEVLVNFVTDHRAVPPR